MARGDHIRVRRRGYWHHGIDCGDGTVIHYTGEPTDWRNAAVRRAPISEFAKGRRVEVLGSHTRLDEDVIIARAESRLFESAYHPIGNNCEHFARWCTSGCSESRQVRHAVQTLSKVLVSAAGVALMVAVSVTLRRGIGRLGPFV